MSVGLLTEDIMGIWNSIYVKGPIDVCWFIKASNEFDRSTINIHKPHRPKREIGVICSNLAIERRPTRFTLGRLRQFQEPRCFFRQQFVETS